MIEIQLDEDVSNLVTPNVTEPVEIPGLFQEHNTILFQAPDKIDVSNVQSQCY